MDEQSGKWSWVARMHDIKDVSHASHSIAVLAVYDPDDECNVVISENQSLVEKPKQMVDVIVSSGSVLTGCGAAVSTDHDAAMSGCSISKYPHTAGALARAFSNEVLSSTHHHLKVYAIGLIPKKWGAIEPEICVLGTAECQSS
jgi:hypothetical protein